MKQSTRPPLELILSAAGKLGLLPRIDRGLSVIFRCPICGSMVWLPLSLDVDLGCEEGHTQGEILRELGFLDAEDPCEGHDAA